MASFKNRKLFLAFNGEFKKQTAFGVPRSVSDMDSRHPQETPTFPTLTVTREQTRDCAGEYIVAEDITSRLRRLQFSFFPDARMLAGWLAYAYGAAAVSAVTRLDPEFSATSTATGGTFKVTFNYDELTDTTPDLPYNITAAALKAALENLSSIKPGNVDVTGTDITTGLTIELKKRFNGAAVPGSAWTIDNSGLTGGTASITLVTLGANDVHTITRNDASDQPPLITLAVGFEGDNNGLLLHDAVVNSATITGQLRGRVQLELDLVMSAKPTNLGTFTAPACVNYTPIKTSDCRLEISGTTTPISRLLREFRFVYSNNILTNDDPFPFDDIDAIRLERGDRTSELTFAAYGNRGDEVYNLAENETVADTTLHIGQPFGRVSVLMPYCKLKLQDTPIAFAGEANRSTVQVTGTPLYAGAGSPDSVSARLDYDTIFLGV